MDQEKIKVFRKYLQRTLEINFYRVNMVDMYNYNMNNVDVSDQLRGYYRFDHWMRKRKWWWSMFFWYFQVLLTNSFIVYKNYMILHIHKPISHHNFHKAVALAWTSQDANWPKKCDDTERIDSKREVTKNHRKFH